MPRHESKIVLEDYSTDIRLAATQAIRVSRLVRNQKKWLQEIQPGTVARYEQPIKAHKNILRLAGAPVLEASMIKRDNVAIGLATIIFGQNIIHPEHGIFAGDDLDYWLQPAERLEVHDAIAQQLLRKHADTSRTGLEESPQAFATISCEHPNPPIGLGRVMTQIGEPAALSTSVANDPYGIARGGKLAQLYVAGQA